MEQSIKSLQVFGCNRLERSRPFVETFDLAIGKHHQSTLARIGIGIVPSFPRRSLGVWGRARQIAEVIDM